MTPTQTLTAKKLSIAAFALLAVTSANAATDAELMRQGIYHDPQTGLYWDRCSVGQTWNGTTCTGQAIELNWQDARDYVATFTNQQAKGGYSDWRLPTIEELSGIRQCSAGWYQNIETKEVSELTAQERVTRTVNLGTKMQNIPASKGGEISVPMMCAVDSNLPLLDTMLFPNSAADFYWSSSFNTINDSVAFGVNFGHGYSLDGKNSSNYVRAVRSIQ